MKCSICLPTYNRPLHLKRCLESIRRQSPTFAYEIIVVDDGSPGPETRAVCEKYDVEKYVFLDRPGWRNPSFASNIAFKRAVGDVLIVQQPDVIHATKRVIQQLCDQLEPKMVIVARVDEFNADTNEIGRALATTSSPWPLLFLGAIHREDMYSIGGNDIEFRYGAHDDIWLAHCFFNNGFRIKKSNQICGLHQSHPRTRNAKVRRRWAQTKAILNQKVADAEAGRIPWCASGGPWTFPVPEDTHEAGSLDWSTANIR